MKIWQLSALLLVLTMTGCNRNSSEQNTDAQSTENGADPVTLQLMTYANEGMVKNYEITVEEFNRSHDDIEVTIHNVYGEDWTDFNRAFKSYIHSGRSPDIADISVIYRDSLIRQGMIKDLMPLARQEGLDFSLYFENQFDGLLIDDSLYGIPSGALLMAVYVNKDLFRQAGVSLPDTDWESSWDREAFAEAAEQIRALSTDERTVYGMTQSYTLGWIIPHLMTSGSDFLTESGVSCTDDATDLVETLSYLGNLMFVEETSPSMMDLVNLQAYQYFMNGNLGIFVDGNWWMEGFRDSAAFEWGVFPMPIDKIPATGMYVDCWMVPEASENGEAAYEVLEFFLEEEQQRSGIMKGIPPLKSAARDIYGERFPNLPDSELSVWFEGIVYGNVPAYFDNWSVFQNETTEILHRHGFGELSSTEAAMEICESFERILSEESL